jgi:hypothetical protein
MRGVKSFDNKGATQMTFAGAEYLRHSDEKEPYDFTKVNLQKFDSIVSNAAKTNQERQADAIAKADSGSFQVANTWYVRSAANERLVNHWLKSNSITQPMFADFMAACEALIDAGALEVDEAAFAQFKDGNGPRTFKGALTKRTYDSLDGLIANERQDAISQITITHEDSAFDGQPIEDVQALLKEAERIAQSKALAPETQANGDAWLTLHPEWRDDDHNAKMMLAQLRLNGVVNRAVTPEDYEIASRQLIAAGMVRLNPAQVKKQQQQDIQDRADNARPVLFDKTSKEDMYNLPLDEVRRRANGNFTGRG